MSQIVLQVMPFSCGVLVAPAADPRGELSHPAPGHTVAWYVDSSVAVKHSVNMEGGPSDIMLRRGMGGLQPAAMVPAVDPACATSDYLTATTLGNAHAENLSSNTPTATSANLTDDTELNYTENALAHRGVLRGGDRWVGWNCTADLVRLWAQLDNYNLWLRKYTVGPFATPVRYSTAAGTVFQDEEYAYESQIVTRPDGLQFYGVWNQGNTVTGRAGRARPRLRRRLSCPDRLQ